MSLLPRNPWPELLRLRQELDRLVRALDQTGTEYAPRVDMYETEREVVVTAEIPGLQDRDDLEVGVTDDTLTIKGEIRRAQEAQEENLALAERFWGRFARAISLPARVVPEKAQAGYRDGVLEVRLPKAEPGGRRPVRLPVH
ncbi:MAG: Hsp20/alpha crystallin family protein [Clostridia bacterium]|mgnify:CR=1 FL=1|nr:Hsp20/alpha crystallin family protein [Clostridia bacterium]MDH7573384.1 Hsp20/alpha crystallin family protein [Clostridia bacterium]